MATWNYYIATDHRPIRLEDVEKVLREADPDFYLDGDVIVLRNGCGEGEELECGQIRVERFADPALLPDHPFFQEQIAGKQSRSRLHGVLDRARSLVVLQLLNTEFWWENDPDRTLRPLQDWLIESFEGALWVEGGEWYDRDGVIP